MSSDKFEVYNGILNAVVSQSIHCSPANWQSGTLTIVCDGVEINYSLKSEDENKASISGELRTLCEELYVVMRQNGDLWLESAIHFSRKTTHGALASILNTINRQ